MPKRVLYLLFSMLFISNILYASKRIVVDISKQRAYAIENGSVVFSGRVSTGKPGHRTPTGHFRVLEKALKHISSKYPEPNGGARMDYMLRVTGSGIAMHLGYVPNYPASHGCIRMVNGFAQKMYSWANVGTPIRITTSSSFNDFVTAQRSTGARKNSNHKSAFEALGFRRPINYIRSHKRTHKKYKRRSRHKRVYKARG